MELRKLLSDTSLRLRKEEIAEIAGTDEDTFQSLSGLAFSREMPICWRASWLMDYLDELRPGMAETYIDSFWKEVSAEHPVGVLRSLLRLLTRYDIPEEYHGMATDLSLEWLEQLKVPVAIKVYAMEMLLKMARAYPELSNEFIMVIEEQLPYGSAGYKARAKRITNALRSIT